MKNMFILIVLMLLISIVSSFVIKPMSKSSSSSLSLKKYNKNVILKMNNDKIDELSSYELPSSALLISLSTLLIPYQEAMANDYGILAGRTASMLHPVTMLMLFLTSVYSGYLGLQWRRLRGISDEIKDYQKQLPILSSGQSTYPLSDKIKSINEQLQSTSDSTLISTLNNDLSKLKNSMDIDTKIGELQATRKQLQSADLKDKHSTTGSYLLGAGVTVSLLGAFNTYMRAGKLFPGPHLYAGMGCTILWAVAAALVPAMQKGNDTARSLHIALNTINVTLFAWQVVTGFDIMVKVWEKTSWP
jgi:hypothetical protein